jgi:putative endonuclease
MRKYHVYIMTNARDTVLCTGVTGNLPRRVQEHKTGMIEGFTRKYGVKKLVYAEEHAKADEAIRREKQIKAGSRAKKIGLIKSINPDFRDLPIVG